MNRAVFVDRDGVICQNRADHVKSWQEFVFLPGAVEALVQLSRAGFYVVVVTNQAVINRGIIPARTVHEIHERMAEAVDRAGGRIDQTLYCPHRPDEQCACRKPAPGLILKAAGSLDIDLASSYMVGDAASDMSAGLTAGCGQCYLVLTGRGLRQWTQSPLVDPRTRVVLDLMGAARSILRRSTVDIALN